MGTPFADVVDGYSKLATQLLEQWSDHASMVAEKLDRGDYDADSAAADLAACARLATESGLLLASEALDAIAILSAGRGGHHTVESETFHAPAGATLELAAPLDDGFGGTLPVSVEPSQLASAETAFILRAHATGYVAATYGGAVVASTSDAGSVTVPVWITT